jgi:AraC-like DNA-binding protein
LDIRARRARLLLVLSARQLLSRQGVEIFDVRCTRGRGTGDPGEQATSRGVVFVRRGCFVRRGGGGQAVLDPTAAYCTNPGEEQRFDHPHTEGDDCTLIALEEHVVASLWGDPTLPSAALVVPPQLDLAHRSLLAGARRGNDEDQLVEQAIALLVAAVDQIDRRRSIAGRPATVRARKALVDGALEALAANSGRCSVVELATMLAVSPHHLSRLFRSVTGTTISRHRMRLRTRAALERLAEGERDIAQLAADTGFADQSHLCRVMRSETGQTPSVLRQALTAAARPAPVLPGGDG